MSAIFKKGGTDSVKESNQGSEKGVIKSTEVIVPDSKINDEMPKLEISSEKEEEPLRIMRTALRSVLAESKVSSNSVPAAVSGTSSAESNSSISGYSTTRRSVIFLQKGSLRNSVPTDSLSKLSLPTESTTEEEKEESSEDCLPQIIKKICQCRFPY